MHAFATRHRLRETPDTRNLPVLAVTAAARQDDRERCLAAGASGYLAKPFNVAKLSRVVADFLLPAE